MKVTVSDSELSAAVSAVGGYCRTAGTRELSCLLLDAGEALSVSATDLNGHATFAAAAMVDEPGRALVPCKAISAIAKGLPAGPVAIEAEGGRCLVSGGRSEFEVPALDPGGFPEPPELGPGGAAVLPAAIVEDMAARVGKAAARPNSGRPAIEGVRVEHDGGRLVMVATDSYKMCFIEAECDGPAFEATVQPGFLDHARSMSGDVELAADGRRAELRCGGSSFSQPQVEGAYPNWRMLAPKDPEAVCEASRDALLAAVRRAASVSGDLPLLLSCSGGALALSLSPRDGDGVAFREEVPCEGDAFEIKLDPGHLLPMVQALGADTARLGFSGPLKPLALEGGAATAVVMPVR